MLGTGLDFEPKTTDACKQLIGSLFTPTQIFSAYCDARAKFGTGDLVLTVSEQDPSGFQADPRAGYIKKLKRLARGKPLPFLLRGIVENSGQAVMNLPSESDALWLVVARGPKEVPLLCVLYATPYEADSVNAAVS